MYQRTNNTQLKKKSRPTMTKWNCGDMIGCRTSSSIPESTDDVMMDNDISSSSNDNSPYRKVITVTKPSTNRKHNVGYRICEAQEVEHQSTAIVWFYPLSGHSLIVEESAQSFQNYMSSVICVDRPGIGDTDSFVEDENEEKNNGDSHNNNASLARIRRHADDVLEVLKHHKITEVYLLGVCIGHPFAAEVGRRLLVGPSLEEEEENEDTEQHPRPKLRGVALVAPFVSTACPESWYIARLGSSVPSFILNGATSMMVKVSSNIVPMFLKPSTVQKLISEEEQSTYGWTDEDFETVCKLAIQINQLSPDVKPIEARLGTDPSWQSVCDAFGSACGYNLSTVNNNEGDDDNKQDDDNNNNEKEAKNGSIHFSIHACDKDKIAPLESVRWVSKRCYGNTALHMEEKIHSHEVMTFLGGPPRNPILLHRIVKDEWQLMC